MRVLITGANRGIGLGFVQSYLKSGDEVLAAVRSPGDARELKAIESNHAGRLRLFVLDLTSPEADAQAREIARSTESIDLLVSNAGYYPEAEGERFSQADLEEWRKGFEINVLGTAKVLYRLLPCLDRSETPKVACISSQMGSIADNSSGGSYGYRMSKAALNMLVKTLAIDYPEVVSLALHPGWVRTRMGGPQALITVEDSVRGLRQVIDGAGTNESGRFFNYRGEEVAW